MDVGSWAGLIIVLGIASFFIGWRVMRRKPILAMVGVAVGTGLAVGATVYLVTLGIALGAPQALAITSDDAFLLYVGKCSEHSLCFAETSRAEKYRVGRYVRGDEKDFLNLGGQHPLFTAPAIALRQGGIYRVTPATFGKTHGLLVYEAEE